mmetsp:Transcript_8305/g.18126  ORF Transcript_8305/g.18126 Transcript_8305/m.18126 type:complete len:94 (+) Transcript_8305:2028-2309(+)
MQEHHIDPNLRGSAQNVLWEAVALLFSASDQQTKVTKNSLLYLAVVNVDVESLSSHVSNSKRNAERYDRLHGEELATTKMKVLHHHDFPHCRY